MLQIETFGVFCVNHENSTLMTVRWLEAWLSGESFSDFKSCLWITTNSKASIKSEVDNLIRKYRKKARFLDVVAIEHTDENHPFEASPRQLADTVQSACLYQPTLVFVDSLEQWLSKAVDSDRMPTPMTRISKLNSWARKRKVALIGVSTGELPNWTPHACGLSHVDSAGAVQYQSWWQQPWGRLAYIWNVDHNQADTPHYLTHVKDFPSLRALGKAIYQTRFSTVESCYLHVHADESTVREIGTALLRLGADSVFYDEQAWNEAMGIQTTKLLTAPDNENSVPTNNSLDPQGFASIIQEIYVPGLQGFIDARSFSSLGLMLCQVADLWQLRPSLTRLSLLGHVSAKQAAQFTSHAQFKAIILATAEALYIFRLWDVEPTEPLLDSWIESNYASSTQSLFAGEVHHIEKEPIERLLLSLNEATHVILETDLLEENALAAKERLADIWNPLTDGSAQHRPWLKRLSNLSEVDLDLVALMNESEGAASDG